ncbi:MAG: hypothetical protein U0350_40705 [Caldilineaceae bacterium]
MNTRKPGAHGSQPSHQQQPNSGYNGNMQSGYVKMQPPTQRALSLTNWRDYGLGVGVQTWCRRRHRLHVETLT